MEKILRCQALLLQKRMKLNCCGLNPGHAACEKKPGKCKRNEVGLLCFSLSTVVEHQTVPPGCRGSEPRERCWPPPETESRLELQQTPDTPQLGPALPPSQAQEICLSSCRFSKRKGFYSYLHCKYEDDFLVFSPTVRAAGQSLFASKQKRSQIWR